MDFVEETELDRVGSPPTDDHTRLVVDEFVGEREREESIEEGGGGLGPKSVEGEVPPPWFEVVGEGRVTRVRREVNEEMDPLEVDELM